MQRSTLSRVRRILVVVLFANLVVAATKLVVGSLSGSVGLIADGFHSLTDASANVVGLVGVSLAARPPDEDHPYGHRKYETLTALLIGGLLMLTAWELLQRSIARLRHGGAPEVTPLTLGVMLTLIVVNLGVSALEARSGRRLRSDILLADAAHTRSDVYTSVTVLVSLVAVRLGFPALDVVAALIVSAVIGRAAFSILRDTAAGLTDRAIVPESEVRRIAEAVEGVQSVHKIRSRGRPEIGYIDLHVQVAADLRLDQAHLIGHLVADRLREELGFKDVTAHVEPPVGHRTDWQPESAPAVDAGRSADSSEPV